MSGGATWDYTCLHQAGLHMACTRSPFLVYVGKKNPFKRLALRGYLVELNRIELSTSSLRKSYNRI